MKKKISIIILLLIIVYFIYGTDDDTVYDTVYHPKFDYSQIFTLKKTEKDKFLFIKKFTKGNYIFEYDITTNCYKYLLGDLNEVLSDPYVSEDGKEIVYTKYNSKNKKWGVYISDIKGDKKIKIIEDDFLFQPQFSIDKEYLYLIKANSFGQGSPLMKAHPANMDIYKVHIISKKVERITFKNYYSIVSYLEIGNKLLFLPLHGRLVVYDLQNKKIKMSEFPIDTEEMQLMSYSEIDYNKEINKCLLYSFKNIYLYDFENDRINKIKSYESEYKTYCFVQYAGFLDRKRILVVTAKNQLIIMNLKGEILKRSKIR